MSHILTRVLRHRPVLTLDDVYADALALAVGDDPAGRLAELVTESNYLVAEAETAIMWTESQQADIREAARRGLTYERLMDRYAHAENYAASPAYAEDADERRLAEYEANDSAEHGDQDNQVDDGFDFWRDVVGDDIVSCADEYRLTSEGVEPLTAEEKAALRAAEEQAETERYAALTPAQRAAKDAADERQRRLLDALRRQVARATPPF